MALNYFKSKQFRPKHFIAITGNFGAVPPVVPPKVYYNIAMFGIGPLNG